MYNEQENQNGEIIQITEEPQPQEPVREATPWTYYTGSSDGPDIHVPVTAEPAKPSKEKKPLTAGLAIVLALCCALVGGVLGAGGMYLFSGNNRSGLSGSVNNPESPSVSDSIDGTGSAVINQGERENVTIEINKVDSSKLMTPAEVYATNINSVVGITTSITTNLWGYQTTSAASGSGLVLTEDGYVLTNEHVIEGSSSITVTFFDGTSIPATLIGYDASNDIAVLKVDATGLIPVTLGDSDKMNVGDQVIAIGNPLGELTFSLTSGVVSALNREVTTSTGVTMNLIQTDCAINSGNSGGPLFNLYGEMIGITNAKYSGNSASGASIDNIGFAIPINNVLDIVTDIMEKGYFSKPYIGISVTDVSSEMTAYGLPQGAAVAAVETGSPAETAGLKVSDIITHADGQAIADSNALVAVVRGKDVGSALKLTVYRQGQTLEITITVGEQIQDAGTTTTPSSGNQQNGGSSGGYGSFPYFGYGY